MTCVDTAPTVQAGVATSRFGELLIRPAGPADAGAILGLYENLLPESRHRRFMRTTPRIPPSLERQLVELEGATVLLAFDGDTCVGEARLVRSRRQPCADLAVTIADSHQRRGLGNHLARMVASSPHGSPCVSVAMMADNTAAIRLATRNRMRLRFDGGVLEGELSTGRSSKRRGAAA